MSAGTRARRAATVLATSALLAGFGVTTATQALASDAAHLTAGDSLTAGQSLVSSNGAASITVQTDGNLVVRTHGGPTWTSGTAGHADHPYLQMQTDGNLVLRDAGGAIWQSQTRGKGGTSLGVQDDGNVVMRTATGAAVWWTGTNLATLLPGHALTAGQYLQSVNGFNRLTMQSDGNLVMRSGNRVVWSPNTHGTGNRLSLNGDGNLVVYNAANAWQWKTSTTDPNVRLVLSNDGNLALYSGSTVRWSTNTVADTLAVGGTLAVGQALVSPNRDYAAAVQPDGNFGVYRSGAPIWQTRTAGAGSVLSVQTDGNLLLRNGSGAATWAANQYDGVRLVMQDDGNLVLRTSSGASTWNTGPDTAPTVPGASACRYVSGSASAGVTVAGISLDATQTTNAMAVARTGVIYGLSQRDIATGLMTAFTESKIRVLANRGVPESESFPHDGYGGDHDSVGIFQQRDNGAWGTIDDRMDRAGSSLLFFQRLKGIANRDSNAMWVNAQKIQVSAYDDGSNYRTYADFGTQLAAYINTHTNPVSVSCH